MKVYMNKFNIELLIQEFREWENDWDKYESNPRHYKKPMNVNDFIKLINKYYKVKIKK